ncbi:MAG: AAA family ATPase [Nostoc sp.]|uniref:AAA family ATPase n=1 Tax=Nostoc sp. TaxID=1180 RepID=UPI002FF988C3
MRICSLEIKNFRAITGLKLTDLSEVVVIAGPNGCGKSCVLDAIRLLKSVYGGYQQNELQQWFNEFQINSSRQEDILSLFQDKNQPLEVVVEIWLSPEEKKYLLNEANKLLQDNASSLLQKQIWQGTSLQHWQGGFTNAESLAMEQRIYTPIVEQRTKETVPSLIKDLNQTYHVGRIIIQPDSNIYIEQSQILELVFGNYKPQHIGIIDYHGASRNYAREKINAINLSLESNEQQLRQHTLYNYTNKYLNLKAEMASGYIRQLLAKEISTTGGEIDTLTTTLKELFTTFFPGKEFLGAQPQADGQLLFPVRTTSGAIHDINELSSGEKEVLYGYLRLRNTAPQNSVLLMDEPELHLNPRLISGLVSFYHKNLGKPLGNQLWLVTHSDTLIREAVERDDFRVFHIQPSSNFDSKNQATVVKADEDVERIIIDLVGDLAAYRPGAKIVIFEGGGNTEFDRWMVSQLFPKFSDAVNFISGGNKRRVADLYEVLENARRYIPAKFYAVTDRDTDESDVVENSNRMSWDVYHIENYLLEPHFIFQVLRDINALCKEVATEEDIDKQLTEFASEIITNVVTHRLRKYADHQLKSKLDLGFGRSIQSVGSELAKAVARCHERIEKLALDELSEKHLTDLEREYRLEATTSLGNGTWRRIFPGRDIMQRFVGRFGRGIPYERFRDLILARMRDKNFQPAGMKQIVERIIANP